MQKAETYILSIGLVVYVAVMFIVSSVYNSTIMDPVQFLWVFCLFIAGPAMFLSSLGIILRKFVSKSRIGFVLVPALLCLVLVPTWTFGFWAIGKACRPVMFSIVADANTAIAESKMMNSPEQERFKINGFRYPFLRLRSALARHQNGVLFITVPSAPGPKDTILYDPQKKVDHAMHQHLSGAWWLITQ